MESSVHRFARFLRLAGVRIGVSEVVDGTRALSVPGIAADRELTRSALRVSLVKDRRDEAMVRLMAETGMRAGEVIGLGVDDVDLTRGLVTVRRGKGGKGRVAPFGAQTGIAIDRYIRMRRGHALADTPPLWLGDRSKGLNYDGLHKTLGYRAELAGLKGFHPHLLRHTAASRWLAAGGSEGGLMAVAGWATRDMIDRYTRSTASDRAAAEARRPARLAAVLHAGDPVRPQQHRGTA